MVQFTDVPTDELLNLLAHNLKEKIKPPVWHTFVKTGPFKERPPVSRDWWYVRAASLLRRVALTGPIGVSKLRTKYGGSKNRGHKPEKFYKASGNHIRKIIQQFEKLGYVKNVTKGVHKGRIVTPAGLKFINATAQQLAKK